MNQKIKEKIENLADKYIDLVAEEIQSASNGHGFIAMQEINDGIRTLNHIISTLQKMEYMNYSNESCIPK